VQSDAGKPVDGMQVMLQMRCAVQPRLVSSFVTIVMTANSANTMDGSQSHREARTNTIVILQELCARYITKIYNYG